MTVKELINLKKYDEETMFVLVTKKDGNIMLHTDLILKKLKPNKQRSEEQLGIL